MLTTRLPDSTRSALQLHYALVSATEPLPLKWLNNTELTWLSGKSVKRAQSFAWSRALLRHLCVEQLNVQPDEVHISLPSETSPALTANGTSYFCSVSHSKHMVAVLLSPLWPVGLDVEYICSKRDKQQYGILYPALRNYCVSNQAFYQRWTQLEASLKLQGGELFELLMQPEPKLAKVLTSWQQQQYQFCVASHHTTAQLQLRQVQLLS